MAYARSVPAAGDIDLERLYALGIDAFRIAHAIALRPQGRSEIDGVTGRLTITYPQGPAQFERALSAVVLRRGAFVAVPQAR